MIDFSWDDPIYLMIIASLLSADKDKVKELKKQWNEYKDDFLNNYNIITAPKTIKLSEIVSKLETSFNYYCTQCRVLKEKDKTIIEYYNYSFIECEYEGYIVIKDNKIIDCDGKLSLEDKVKWLYALWITGTIIEDDLRDE